MKKQFRALLEKQHKLLAENGRVHKITASELRVKISKFVSQAWKEVVCEREFMRNTFRKTGLSLPIDGSQDGEMSFCGVKCIQVPQ